MFDRNLLLVGVGGFVGAMTRYLVGNWVGNKWGVGFPYGTFLINVTGSFVLGAFYTLSSQLGWWEGWRLMGAVGFVGAYTTFSTFEYETLRLVVDQRFRTVSVYVAGSVVFGFIAAWTGTAAADWLLKLRGNR